MITASTVHARSIGGIEPPADIQFMPPGRQTITCSVGGQAKTITANITSATAAMLEGDRQRMAAAAQRNQGDKPYLDLNHDDAEAAAYVTEIFWGGDDPLTGGVRARVEWTSAGDAALRGRTYRRFSPSFLVDAAGNIAGLGNENLGGLVNRAAFKTIQPVMAKSAALSELARSAGVGEDEPFFSRVAEVMEQEGLNEKLAWASVVQNDPGLWLEHVYAMLGLDPEQAKRLGIKTAVEATAHAITPETYVSGRKVLKSMLQDYVSAGAIDNHPLCVQARALARQEGIDFADAAQRVAAKHPALYTAYLEAQRNQCSLAPENPKPAKAAPQSAAAKHPFLVQARALAERKDIELFEATQLLAAKEPQLYQSYVEAVAPR